MPFLPCASPLLLLLCCQLKASPTRCWMFLQCSKRSARQSVVSFSWSLTRTDERLCTVFSPYYHTSSSFQQYCQVRPRTTLACFLQQQHQNQQQHCTIHSSAEAASHQQLCLKHKHRRYIAQPVKSIDTH